MPSEESTRNVERQSDLNSFERGYAETEASDSTHQGTTKRGERESTDKQKAIGSTVIVVVVIILFVGSLALLGADK